MFTIDFAPLQVYYSLPSMDPLIETGGYADEQDMVECVGRSDGNYPGGVLEHPDSESGRGIRKRRYDRQQ